MNASRQRFLGKVGVVTGASGLLGRSVVRALVDEGARVIASDLPGDALDTLSEEVGDAVRCVPADVTNEEEVATLFDAAVSNGPLNFVFNNAGVEGSVGAVRDLDIPALRRALDINVVGTAIVLKHALLAVADGAHVVQSGSTASLSGAAGMAPYVVSKHGVLGLTRTASKEEAGKGIRVNAVLPGPIASPMMSRIAAGRESAMSAVSPLSDDTLNGGRQAEVHEIVSAVLFLLSDESSFVAGSGLLVDGGRNA